MGAFRATISFSKENPMHRPVRLALLLAAVILTAACSPLPKGVVGLATKVSKKGSMLECTFYNNGKEVAKTFFDESGAVLRTEGRIPDGPVKQMLSEKVVGMELNYVNNLKEGPYKAFNPKGQVVSEGGFRADKPDGVIKTFDEKGAVALERTLKAGVLDGPSRWFYPNGKPKVEKTYRDGKEDGTFTWWDEQGNVTATETYKGGVKIK
jgi:antitoxin component YwqK of YwqJK toxin-antitoxin module